MRMSTNATYSFDSDSEKGQREKNEDRHKTWGAGDYIVLVVADGVGGHAGGEIASQMLIDVFDEVWNVQTDGPVIPSIPKSTRQRQPEESTQESAYEREAVWLKRLIERANQKILDEARANPEYNGMATTVVAVIINTRTQNLYYAHVGDSRIYLIENGDRITQLTRDHYDSETNRVTRVVGIDENLEVEVGHEGKGYNFQPTDALLLCTDGLSSAIRDSERIRAVLSKAYKVPKVACERLIEDSLKRGSDDNITVALAIGSEFSPSTQEYTSQAVHVQRGPENSRQKPWERPTLRDHLRSLGRVVWFIIGVIIGLAVAYFLFVKPTTGVQRADFYQLRVEPGQQNVAIYKNNQKIEGTSLKASDLKTLNGGSELLMQMIQNGFGHPKLETLKSTVQKLNQILLRRVENSIQQLEADSTTGQVFPTEQNRSLAFQAFQTVKTQPERFEDKTRLRVYNALVDSYLTGSGVFNDPESEAVISALQQIQTISNRPKTVILTALEFPSGGTVPKPGTDVELGKIAEILRSGQFRIQIAGHTDADGSDRVNRNLSQSRADGLKTHLTTQLGVSESLLHAVGMGSRKPRFTPPKNIKNRRIEITFSGIQQ
jgi:PPM family protein phosphatase